ncbi:SPRY domain-containing protein [Metarhizium guizhouense ARSEF 977]|uniref:SPRY domain-containing protein n=1 Tax=Metarhizium guizhouense (strain ARSEF 977) TaxID=1276136 RepID=A0A0B4GQM5_METGA|nr:SPRY domain-containing protein [Metarhizium guizhouense ARSEF 977]
MCSGGKNEMNNDPAPRPAQKPQRPERVKNPSWNPYPSSAASSSKQHTYAPPSGPPPSQQQYAAPPGPPPSHHQNEFAPPAGPPPGHKPGYAPPPSNQDWAVPPPEAPPSQKTAEHDWEAAVPDTSLFPPPPAIFSGHDYSPTNNATEEEAEAGEAWCAQHPLSQPLHLDAAAKTALHANNFRLMEPAGFNGKLNWLAPGHWEASTANNAPDKCIIGYPPLYLVHEHDPTRHGQPKTIYYEVKVRRGSKNNTVAVGFTALPYPSFRLPGWHRGSLAVHSDDGRKYINDRWGGKDFTRAFRKGETLGIGMTFAPTGTSRPDVSVFFTRDGVRAGGWDLHEETDAEQDLPVTGLEGFHDLTCAIGVFDSADIEVVFDPAKWKYKPT